MTESEIMKRIAESNLLLTYFSQPVCTVCKTLRPKVEALVAKYPATDFQYINTQIYPGLRGQYLVFAVPTILLFHQGREVKRWSRYLSVEEIRYELNRYQQLTDS